jgi:hypothetical protein
MPEDPNEPVRVLDKDNGRKSTIRRVSLPHGNYEVLDEPAVSLTGAFLPPEFPAPVTTPKLAAKNKGQSATIEKESDNG